MKIKSNLAVSDTGFIFNPSNGDSFSTNAVGAAIFRLLKEGKSFESIKKELLESYEVDPVVFEKDFHDFVAQLQDHYLVSND
jgi:hypothetical protein